MQLNKLPHNPLFSEMTLLDYFVSQLPEPDKYDIEREVRKDKGLNPYNEQNKPKLRSQLEIICDLKYQQAIKLLEARELIMKPYNDSLKEFRQQKYDLER